MLAPRGAAISTLVPHAAATRALTPRVAAARVIGASLLQTATVALDLFFFNTGAGYDTPDLFFSSTEASLLFFPIAHARASVSIVPPGTPPSASFPGVRAARIW